MSLRHDVAGDGPTLVLVHGVVHRRQAWDPVLDLLTPYRRVVTVDLPGHGESDDVDVFGAERLAAFIESLSDFVTEVGGPDEPVHIAGNSLGGFLAMALAARGDVASATALSPAGFWKTPAAQARGLAKFRALRAAAGAMGDQAPKAFRSKLVRYPSLAPFFAHPSRISYENAVIDVGSLLTNTTLAGGVDAPFELPPVTSPLVPVTVAWGTRDLILPHRDRHNVATHFPHARIISVPGVGHVPMSDNPELIASILLAGSEPAASPR
ncbi:alpha/beta fold hydrolase [Williamsia herbipolensis]|uniref:Alpha/beta fold hydrolase n=1 Tax=Williamsia herbipolensis TaxID=1603258 RepID=A0AAU4K5T6_9NOCA|nr:alpha/beta fold hydrolase [Williamsia herbipolensis]